MILRSSMSWSPWLGATLMLRRKQATMMTMRQARPRQKLWPWLWPQRKLSRRRRKLPRPPVSPDRASPGWAACCPGGQNLGKKVSPKMLSWPAS